MEITVNEVLSELNNIKGQIDSAKRDAAQIDGQLIEQFKVLNSFDVKTVKEAQKVKAKKVELKSKIETQILEGYMKLKEMYAW